MESELHELEQLEDKDIQIKQKVKKDHKFDSDDCFYRIKLTYNNLSKICKMKQSDIDKGYLLVVSTQYGPEIGIVQGQVFNMDAISSEEEVLEVIRKASKSDRATYKSNLYKQEEAFDIAVKMIAEHKLEMKLINVHYFFEEQKILFNFIADGRIDFRELVKELASVFKSRIELRQIGVRDQCRIISGYGHCGRPFCCSSVANELNPVTIKMAKEQNVTLNSIKISGVCGRLLCCLSYEYETYIEEKKEYPLEGAKIKVNNEWFYVTEVNIQNKTVKLSTSSNDRFLYIPLKIIQYDKNKKIGIVKEKIEL